MLVPMRDRDFFRYGDYEHVVDPDESTLVALIDIKEEGIKRYWILGIRCTREGLPWEIQPANLQEVFLHVPFTDWREFAGQRFEQKADLIRRREEPVANLYTGLHDAVSEFQLQFGERNGCQFRLRCSGVAEGGEFLVDGAARVSEVIVRDWIEERGDVQRAAALATETLFRPDELGEPEVWHGWVTFPIKATD